VGFPFQLLFDACLLAFAALLASDPSSFLMILFLDPQ
jgi:hypothetical protein